MALELRRAGITVGGEAEVRGPILGLGSLTAREREAFELLVSGLRVSSIARSLYLSENTVRSQVSAVFRKLGVRSQSELMERVASQGSDRHD